MVPTTRVGTPRSTTDFSCRVAVGQACTHAPQDTHSDSMKVVPPGETVVSKPRPSRVSAKVPWTSSHARTQREQAMHLDISKSKYGFEESVGRSRWLAPASTPEP